MADVQKDRAIDLWQAIAQTDELVDFFTGLFDVIGITIEETGEQCVTYQKQVFKAMKADSLMGWIRFARWYVAWRPSASV